MSRILWLVLLFLFIPQAIAEEVKDIDAFLADVRERGYLNVPPEHGRFLQLMTELRGAKRVLEVGTSTGYSGLWIARGLRRTGGKLDTIEIDQGRAETARQNFKKAGVDDIITIHVDDAFKAIPKLEGEFDMIFLDAGSFKRFFDAAYPRLRPGGVLLTHNALLLKGETQKLLDATKDNPQVISSVIQIGSDGFGVFYKRLPETR